MSEEPPSPCTGVCRIASATALCEGCTRTMDEIIAWSTMGAADKRAVWERIRARRA